MAAKNAILIVEYATDYRKAGMPVRQAAESAGNVRLRPILMTAHGIRIRCYAYAFRYRSGAGSRLSLGTAVVFGMAVNAVLGTLFVPNWELFENIREKYLSKMFSGSDTMVPPSKDDETDSSDNI